jgi:hypothetical protein
MTRINLFQKRSVAAKKGNRTRRVRDEFVAKFGTQTLFALRQILTGNDWFASSYSEEAKRSFATYKANLTRGVYYPFAYVRSDGRVDNKLKISNYNCGR